MISELSVGRAEARGLRCPALMEPATKLARRLVDEANARGGTDNLTAAAARGTAPTEGW